MKRTVLVFFLFLNGAPTIAVIKDGPCVHLVAPIYHMSTAFVPVTLFLPITTTLNKFKINNFFYHDQVSSRKMFVQLTNKHNWLTITKRDDTTERSRTPSICNTEAFYQDNHKMYVNRQIANNISQYFQCALDWDMYQLFVLPEKHYVFWGCANLPDSNSSEHGAWVFGLSGKPSKDTWSALKDLLLSRTEIEEGEFLRWGSQLDVIRNDALESEYECLWKCQQNYTMQERSSEVETKYFLYVICVISTIVSALWVYTGCPASTLCKWTSNRVESFQLQ